MEHLTLPLARHDGLVIQSLDQETIVFDSTTNKAYVLSPTASAVWKACDGTHTIHDLTQVLHNDTPSKEQHVWLALEQLSDLLQERVALPPEFVGMSRRQFLRNTGLAVAGVTIPLVIKMVAPTPAMAQSSGTICCICENGRYAERSSCGECVAACDPLGGFVECLLGLCA